MRTIDPTLLGGGALSGESESESWLDAEMDAVGMEAGCARAKAAKKDQCSLIHHRSGSGSEFDDDDESDNDDEKENICSQANFDILTS